MLQVPRALAWLGLALGIGWSGAATAADYLLTQPVFAGRPTGARLQIGTGLPLPVGPLGIFTGGQMSVTGVTTTRMGGGMSTTTGPGIWPPLLIGPTLSALTGGKPISQNLTTAKGGAVKIPATVLKRDSNGVPAHGGVFNTNPAIFDVATTIDYQWPSATATFSPGGAPGAGAFFNGPGGGTIFYNGGTKAFGGPAVFAIQAGPNAGTRLIPPNMAGMKPIVTVFIDARQQWADFAALVGASNPIGALAQGAPIFLKTSFGPVSTAVRPVNADGPPCTMWCVGPNGTIMGLPNDPTTITTWSVGPGIADFTHNDATSEGFPWTTGLVTVYAPGALGGETFYLKGQDLRSSGAGMTGVGNLSLVSGSLSQRNLSHANANRAFVSLNLPEPGAGLGAAAALGALALGHGWMRRSRRC